MQAAGPKSFVDLGLAESEVSGLEKTWFKPLRDSASIYVTCGTNLGELVMSQMRHRSIETTMKNYFRADVAKTARKFLKIKGCTLGCTPKPTTSRR